MELIRFLLLQIDAKEEINGTNANALVPDGYTLDQVFYNCTLMEEAGLIQASISTGAKGTPIHALIKRLTWSGHDFLDAVRDETLWEKAKEKVLKPSASWTFGILLEWAKMEIKARLPV